MKKAILGIILGAGLSSGVVMASIADDIINGVSMAQVVANALSNGHSLNTAVHRTLEAAPQQADAIIAAFVAANPANAQAVVVAAVASCVVPSQAIDAAIAGGADPNSVSASPIHAGPPCITPIFTGNSGNTNSSNTISLPASISSTGAGGGGGGGVISTN